MTQFDVLPNPVPQTRGLYPFVVILQADTVPTNDELVLAFLSPRQRYPATPGRLNPVVDVGGEPHVLLTQSITNLRKAHLRRPVGTVASDRDKITAALDFLFFGF